MKRLILIVPVVALIVALVGCSAPDNGSVTITDTGFTPAKVTIKAGGSVTWTNNSQAAHTISTSDFDSAAISQGQTFTTKLNKTGTVKYSCGLHPAETGEIVVK